MAFFKKIQKKINGLWYPQSVTVGKPVTTDQVADRLADVSTVSRSDTYAVLKGLAGVLADYMAQGRTVKLEGLGTFYYTADATGKGVDSADKVNATQISGVRVRFIPEARRAGSGGSGGAMTRSLVSTDIFWEEWGGKTAASGGGDQGGEGGGDGGGEAPDPLA